MGAKSNKILVWILAVLCVVIVGLAVGIVVVNLNNGQISGGTGETSTDDSASDGFETTMSDDELVEFNNFQDEYNATQAKAQKILMAEPVDATALNELYSPIINRYAEEKNYSRAQSYIMAEYDGLMSKGLEREALDLLAGLDFNYFPAPVQHRMYLKIIDLAQKLGDSSVMEKYEPMAADTQRAFETSDEAIKKSVEQYRTGEQVQGETE